MEPRSVLVSYTLDSSKNPFSCSGTLISDEWVLTHGSLLEPLVLQSDDLQSLTDDLKVGVLVNAEKVEKSPKFSVSWEARNSVTSPPPCCGAKVLPNMSQSSRESSRLKPVAYVTKKARLAAVWKCPLLVEAFEGILASWRFSEAPRRENVAVSDKELFPLILLLKVDDSNRESNISEARNALNSFRKLLATPQRGNEVEIESTPFGNPVFMNSVANGVISNLVGPAKSIILTDAKAVIGCEGGPIFVRYKRYVMSLETNWRMRTSRMLYFSHYGELIIEHWDLIRDKKWIALADSNWPRYPIRRS